MSDPQRYEMVEQTRGMEVWHELQPDPTGDWMRYEDHAAMRYEDRAALRAELDALRTDKEYLKANRDYWMKTCQEAQTHRDGANEQLAIQDAQHGIDRRDAERYRMLRMYDLSGSCRRDDSTCAILSFSSNYDERNDFENLDKLVDQMLAYRQQRIARKV